MASQCYFAGDFYECVSDTSAGQSPGTHPAKWNRLTLPEEWQPYLEEEAVAFALQANGESHLERVLPQRRLADAALDRLALNYHRENGNGQPIQVFTR
jgi:hypothetical protein